MAALDDKRGVFRGRSASDTSRTTTDAEQLRVVPVVHQAHRKPGKQEEARQKRVEEVERGGPHHQREEKQTPVDAETSADDAAPYAPHA
jgi:hypothetical protein